MDKILNLEKPEKTFRVSYMNKEETEAEIIIYDEIGKESWWGGTFGVKDLDAELKNLDEKKIEKLHVRINSGGGSVFEGWAIYNRLKNFDADIIVHVDGLAASIASIIAMAGDEIIMNDPSYMMIHKPWTCACGNSTDLERNIQLLDDIESQMINVYRRKTSKDSTEIAQLLEAETWMSARDAVDMGFATRLADEDEGIADVAASVDCSWFKNKPKLENLPSREMAMQNQVNNIRNRVKEFRARHQ